MEDIDRTVVYKGKKYPVKEIILFDSTEDAMRVNVSTEELSQALYDSESGYRDEEARHIDESIYFFLDAEMFNKSKKEIVEYLEKD